MLIKRLTIILSSTEARYSYYNRLFDKFSHLKLIIAEELCYGGEQAVFCAAASDRGIVAAEYQHGMISSGHTAYVHSDKLCRNDMYKRTLPQYFLGFGKWWGTQIRIPSKFIPIGYPHRTEQLKNLKDDDDAHTKDILVLGQTDNTVLEWLDICAELAEKLGAKYRIVFLNSFANKAFQHLIVAALLSSFLFIQKIFFHDSGISTIFSTLYEINSASLWYFFRYNNFSSNTLSCLPSLNLSKNPIKISLSVHLSLVGQSVQRLGRGVMPPALGQNVPAGAARQS